MSTNVWYVVITLKNGEVYEGVSAELGPRVTEDPDPATADTQGIRLRRFNCSTFIPGQDVKSVEWIECQDKKGPVPEPVSEPEPELELVTT